MLFQKKFKPNLYIYNLNNLMFEISDYEIMTRICHFLQQSISFEYRNKNKNIFFVLHLSIKYAFLKGFFKNEINCQENVKIKSFE